MTDFVLGHGPGQVEQGLDIATHSIYARSAYEQGVLGLVLISTLMIATLAFAWGLARRDVDVNGVGSAALLGSWLGLVASGFFIDTLHWRHLWFVAALIWVGAAPHQVRSAHRRPGRRRDDRFAFKPRGAATDIRGDANCASGGQQEVSV